MSQFEPSSLHQRVLSATSRRIAKGESDTAEFVVLAAGNALAEQTFTNCTCPKPKGCNSKTVEAIEEMVAADGQQKTALDKLIRDGFTHFIRRTFVYHPDGDTSRLMKRDDWVLQNQRNGDEVNLKSPLARAYGHLKAKTHGDEAHTDETKKTAALAPLSRQDLLLVVQGERGDTIGQCSATQGDCIPTSTAVHEALQNRYPDAKLRQGVYFRNREEEEGWLHTWVEIPSQNLYIDATHDQFDGGEPILIGRIGGTYYREHYEIDEDIEDYKTAATFQNKPARFDLGDGYTLAYEAKGESDTNTWVVTHSGVDYKVGEITVDFYPDIAFPSIRSISLASWGEKGGKDDHQRKGLGRKIVQTLSKFYGGLTSDPQRNTNALAKGMWRGVPGVQEVVAPKEFQHGDKPAERRLPWETDEFLTRGKYFQVQGSLKIAHMPKDVVQKATEMHDQIKYHADRQDRMKLRRPDVQERTYERQQPQLLALLALLERHAKNRGHLNRAKQELNSAEFAYHGAKNYKGESMSTAISYQETALMFLHQILREDSWETDVTAGAAPGRKRISTPAPETILWASRQGEDYIGDQDDVWNHATLIPYTGKKYDAFDKGYAYVSHEEHAVELKAYDTNPREKFTPRSIVDLLKKTYPELKRYKFTDGQNYSGE